MAPGARLPLAPGAIVPLPSHERGKNGFQLSIAMVQYDLW